MNTFDQSCFLKRMRDATPVSDETAVLLAEHLTECCFEKRDIVLRDGYFCKYVWFVERGMVRHYWVVDGNEIVTSFSMEGQAVFSMDELYFGKKSQEYAQAIEPVEAYRISVKDMNRLLSTNLELCNWWRLIHQFEYRRIHQSHKERLTLAAKDRYLAFTQEFPEVCRRANLYDIASYLGITPSTLSKMRVKLRDI